MYIIEHSVRQPRREISDSVQSQLKYYTKEMHSAGFMLPRFSKMHFESVIRPGK